jgi:hypothetical protein
MNESRTVMARKALSLDSGLVKLQDTDEGE